MCCNLRRQAAYVVLPEVAGSVGCVTAVPQFSTAYLNIYINGNDTYVRLGRLIALPSFHQKAGELHFRDPISERSFLYTLKGFTNILYFFYSFFSMGETLYA